MPDPMLKVLVTVVRSPSIRVKSRDPLTIPILNFSEHSYEFPADRP